MCRSTRYLLLAICLSVVALSAVAANADGGWSADPSRNLAIADRADEQVQVKIAPTSDGGCYVSWYDNATGGYDMALQRLDAQGVEQWAHNGIIVADTGFSWTMDYGLAVDADDEALLAFRDDRGGVERIAVARVAPDGTMLWDPNGVHLDGPAEFLGPPKIVVTADDQVVVAWTHDTDIRVRRLDLAANPLWAGDVVFADPTGAQQMLADLQPTPDGGVIVSWVHARSYIDPRHLYAQKLTRDGVPVWGEGEATSDARQPLVVFDAGTLQYGNFPPFLSDGAGGAVFAWYETDPILQTRVQHVRADGTLRFGPNGALAAAEWADIERVEPAVAFDPATQDIYVFWRQTPHAGPLAQSIRGQRFAGDGGGTWAWGAEGKVFEPPIAHEVTQLEAEAFAGGVLLAYAEKLAEGDQRLWIRRLDPTGASVWASERVAVSSVVSAKSRLDMAISTAGFALLGWQDDRAGSEDIYMQNVNADGSLGPSGAPSPTAPPVSPTGTSQPTGEASPTGTSEPPPTSPPTVEPSPTDTQPPERWWVYLPVLNPRPAQLGSNG